MTEAIERMARAIDDAYDVDERGEMLNLNEVARAVLQAIREPTEAQIDAFVARALQVKLGGDFTWNDYARLQWTGMIDAAMGDG